MDLAEMVFEQSVDDVEPLAEDGVDLGPGPSRPRSTEQPSLQNEASLRKGGSIVWKYFAKCDGGGLCNVCHKIVPTGKSATTTGLIRHLSSHHLHAYGKYINDKKNQSEDNLKATKTKALPKTTQGNIGTFFSNQQKLDSKSPRASAITTSIAMMMALDFQPYSLVSDKGFQQLMKVVEPRYVVPARSTFSRQIVPALFTKVKTQTKECIDLHLQNGIVSISLTTDGWTSRANHSYISLTTHYITTEFDAIHCVLANSHMPGAHTAEHLLKKLKSLVLEWGIDDGTIPIFVVADNAKNIQGALNRSDWQPVQCFAHTLQLVIVDALNEVVGFANMCKKARSIVGHYKRSSSALNRLEACQQLFNLPSHSLIQDVDTRWNSQFAMLNRLVEQRRAISSELAEGTSNIDNLTNSDWMLAEGAIHILEPIDRATREVCSEEYPTRSMIIPLIHCMENKILAFVTNASSEKRGITFARNIDRKLKSRFPNYKRDQINVLAMAVDPRFKLIIVTDNVDKMWAINLLKGECMRVFQAAQHESGPEEAPVASASTSTSLWEDFESIKGIETLPEPATDKISDEISAYMKAKLISRNENPLAWWKTNALLYPVVAVVARKYLGIPASQVASERLFSTAGNIVTNRRECLDPERVEQLCFLNKNLKI